MSKYREEFEQKGNIKIFVKLCMFDELINEYSSDKLHDYTLGFINSAWWAFQEQQKRIDELQAKLDACQKLLEKWKTTGLKGASDYAVGGAHTRQECENELKQAFKGGEK